MIIRPTRSIDVYRVDAQDFAAVNGKKFKLDPQRLLYSRQWLHKGTPPDLHLQLVRESGEWFDSVATSPLGALNRHDPQLRDRLRAATALDHSIYFRKCGKWTEEEVVERRRAKSSAPATAGAP